MRKLTIFSHSLNYRILDSLCICRGFNWQESHFLVRRIGNWPEDWIGVKMQPGASDLCKKYVRQGIQFLFMIFFLHYALTAILEIITWCHDETKKCSGICANCGIIDIIHFWWLLFWPFPCVSQILFSCIL